jgi:hypothetical protein
MSLRLTVVKSEPLQDTCPFLCSSPLCFRTRCTNILQWFVSYYTLILNGISDDYIEFCSDQQTKHVVHFIYL